MEQKAGWKSTETGLSSSFQFDDLRNGIFNSFIVTPPTTPKIILPTNATVSNTPPESGEMIAK